MKSTKRTVTRIDGTFEDGRVAGGDGSARKASIRLERRSHTGNVRHQAETRYHSRQSLHPRRPGAVVQTLRARANDSPFCGSHTQSQRIVPVEALPSVAVYQAFETADVFPWTGIHNEDQLTEQTARNGFHGRAHLPQNESATARPLLWSAVKQDEGLSRLSAFVNATVQKRSESGDIKHESSFKLPPRVTLTDAKREAWLKGLANPWSPLRTLSRSIPHGVRGRALLDHCLRKRVPPARATWLAKCVGANEIRAFKRKGAGAVFAVGGELKWIKDWTTGFQQFLTALVMNYSSTEGEDEIYYGVEISHQFLSANLLDTGQYCEWLITSIHTTSLESLYGWLLLSGPLFKGLQQHRRYSVHLANTLLDRLSQVSIERSQSHASLSNELSRLLQYISLTCDTTACRSQLSWEKSDTNVKGTSSARHSSLITVSVEHETRSQRLQDEERSNLHHDEATLEQYFATLFETSLTMDEVESCALSCLISSDDHHLLLKSCLQWCSVKTTDDASRIYTAAALIKSWSRLGVQAEVRLLEVLGRPDDHLGNSAPALCHLLTELMVHRIFSIGRYCHWLMSHNYFESSGTRTKAISFHIFLLQNLPVHTCPLPVQNLRRALLRKSLEQELPFEALRHDVRQLIRSNLASDQSDNYRTPMIEIDAAVASFSPAIRHAASHDLVDDLLTSCKMNDSSGAELRQMQHAHKPRSSRLSAATLRVAARLLVGLGDLRRLGQLLRFTIPDASVGFIIQAVEIINQHFANLRLLGILRRLIYLVCKAVGNLQALQPQDLYLLECLKDLSVLVHQEWPVAKALVTSIDFCESLALRVVIPMSPLPGNLTSRAEYNFLDGLRKTTAVVRSMDNMTCERAFKILSTSAVATTYDYTNTIFHTPFLGILRVMKETNPFAFQDLSSRWVQHELSGLADGMLPNFTVLAVCAGLCSLKLLVETIISNTQSCKLSATRCALAEEMFDILSTQLDDAAAQVHCLSYRLLAQRRQLLHSDPILVCKLATQLLSISSGDDVARKASSYEVHRSKKYLRLINQACRSVHFRKWNTYQSVGVQVSIGQCIMSLEAELEPQQTLSQHLHHILYSVTGPTFSSQYLKLESILHAEQIGRNNPVEGLLDILANDFGHISLDRANLWVSMSRGIPHTSCSQVSETILSVLFGSLLYNPPKWVSFQDGQAWNLCAIYRHTLHHCDLSMHVSLIQKIAIAATNILALSEKEVGSTSKPSIDLDWVLLTLRLLGAHGGYLSSTADSQRSSLAIILVKLCLRINAPQPRSLEAQLVKVMTFLAGKSPADISACFAGMTRPSLNGLIALLGISFTSPTNNHAMWLFKGPVSPLRYSIVDGWQSESARGGQYQFQLRNWELISDAAPMVAENDAAINLGLFETHKSLS